MMVRVKLEDVCVKASSNLMQKDIIDNTGQYPIYGAAGKIRNVDFYQQKSEYIAIVKDGAGIGKTMLLPPQSSVIGTMLYLLPKDNINVDFLYYVVNNMHLEKYASGAAIPHIYFRDFRNEEFNLPSIVNQKLIVKNLNNIREIIESRRHQLDSLSDLIKSRFAEMFGKPLTENKRFEFKSIKEVGTVVSGATPKTSVDSFWNGEIKWISPAELKTDTFYINDSIKTITEKGFRNCGAVLMPKGTVILSSRAPIGKTGILSTEMCCNQGFKNIIPGPNIDSIYLYWVLKQSTKYLNSLGRGATFKEISKKIVEDIMIVIPPINYQNEFSNFVKHVDKSKFAIQKSLEKDQMLYDKLMQEYFG